MKFEKNYGEGLDLFQIWGIVSLLLFLIARFFPFFRYNIPLCTFRRVTGIPCPTCGMTTCFIYMTHFQIKDAIIVSPLGSVVFLFSFLSLLYFIFTCFFKLPKIKIVMSKREKSIFMIIFVVLLLLNWFYNINHLL